MAQARIKHSFDAVKLSPPVVAHVIEALNGAARHDFDPRAQRRRINAVNAALKRIGIPIAEIKASVRYFDIVRSSINSRAAG